MNWVLEEPIYIAILGVLMVAFLGFALVQTGYRWLLHAIVAVVALTIGCLILERMVETDKEQIETALQTIARDVESNDLDAICSHIYSGAPKILERARSEFPSYKFDRVKIKSNVEIEFEPGSQPRKANVTFNVVVDVHHMGVHYPHVARFVRVTLVFEDGQWRIADYSHDQPLSSFQLP